MLIVKVKNISDLSPISDYRYSVFVNEEKIKEGIIKNHNREEGWRKLIQKIAEENE